MSLVLLKVAFWLLFGSQVLGVALGLVYFGLNWGLDVDCLNC